jgi:AraC-like DNA-binding protein
MNSQLVGYREYRPTWVLRPYVSCYWSSCEPAPLIPVERRVLPDGCIDILFDLSSDRDSRGLIVGTMTRPLLFHTSDRIQFIAVRFRPGGAVPFLRIPAAEITDSQCELPKAWHADRLAERFHAQNELSEKVRLLEAALLSRLENTLPVDHRIQSAVSMIQDGRTVEQVAKKLALSRQHLTRLFKEHVGIGAKVFARVDRFQRLLGLIKGLGRTNWASVSLDVGYYDQAHLIAECRSLAGLTPTELHAR